MKPMDSDAKPPKPTTTPTETVPLAIGPNVDGHDDQAVVAHKLEEQLDTQRENAPDVAGTHDVDDAEG